MSQSPPDDLVGDLQECLRLNVADLNEHGHLCPRQYQQICICVSNILGRLGKVAGLAASALTWSIEALGDAIEDDPERFTTLDSMMDADLEENCYPPHDYDSRTRAINGVKNSLEFTVYLLNNVKTEIAWELHKCASDAFLRSLGRNMGGMEKKSVCFAMRACLKDIDWFVNIVGTSRESMPEQIDAVLAAATVILGAVKVLHEERKFPYDMAIAAKNSKRRQPYKKYNVKKASASSFDGIALMHLRRSKSTLGESFYTCASRYSYIQEPNISTRCNTCTYLSQLMRQSRGDQRGPKANWLNQFRVVMLSRTAPQG